ncbi:MAG: Hsp20/alpha crystallin family protein [Treponema sp.]|nr:Hsp20/alpha crystallin family protein [Treponema sp.]
MKTLSFYGPNSIQNALNDFDRYLESFFGDSFLAPAARIFNQLPAVDIQENENAYVLHMDLPGFDEKNINVHVDGSSLTIASRQETAVELAEQKTDEGKGAYILRERKINSFTRSFKLPENADPEAVNASFKNGVLCLEIKKRAEAQKRTIQINVA